MMLLQSDIIFFMSFEKNDTLHSLNNSTPFVLI